ncbi:hypothetical protein AZE42_08755 [Rhizopogon vesiculosus]|uniref:Uncharacterized protein n=1 Tax=Rhizopogon vesiculosus TaxID=180088 RepID=A0A1J8QZ79_9AGAM|nr:hypothetical protein AZE42_08755 [Rhizopogon vesiculosus]
MNGFSDKPSNPCTADLPLHCPRYADVYALPTWMPALLRMWMPAPLLCRRSHRRVMNHSQRVTHLAEPAIANLIVVTAKAPAPARLRVKSNSLVLII